MALRVIFLDRHGTVNVDHGYVSRVADWQFTDRAIAERTSGSPG